MRKKFFQTLGNADLLNELKKYDKIIKEFQKPIDEYDRFYSLHLKTKNDKVENWDENPIVVPSPLILKDTSHGGRYIMDLSKNYYETIEEESPSQSGKYVLTKEGSKIVFNQKKEFFLKRKREIELILRARKKEKEKTDNVGFVYVLSNKSLPPNTFKIGSTYGIPEERAEELTGTGHLNPFKVETFIKIKSAEFYEKKIHSLLKDYRIKKNREFFEIELNKIKKILNEVSVLTEKGERKLNLSDLKKKLK